MLKPTSSTDNQRDNSLKAELSLVWSNWIFKKKYKLKTIKHTNTEMPH